MAISHSGSQIAWTDTENEIFTANSDGSNRKEIASTTVYGGVTREPKFRGTKLQFARNGKLYYMLYMGKTGDAAGVSGIYEINPDGSGQKRLFAFPELWPVVPKKADQSVDPGEFDISDDGTRFILSPPCSLPMDLRDSTSCRITRTTRRDSFE